MPCAVSFNGLLSAFYGCIVYHKPIKGQLNHLLLKHYKTLCLKCHSAAYTKEGLEQLSCILKKHDIWVCNDNLCCQ